MNFLKLNKVNQSKIMERLFKLNWGAHHPSCNRYNNHLIRILNHPLCIGCTFMSLGIITGFLILLFTEFHSLKPSIIWITGFFFYLSAIIQTKLTKNKRIKMGLRFFLGIGTIFLLGAVILIPLSLVNIFVKLFLFWLFYFVFKKTNDYRAKKIDDQCIHCPDGTHPLCIHKKIKMIQILDEYHSKKLIIEDRDEKLIPLLTALVDQFEGGEKSVKFERDFADSQECDANISPN